jgi:hypothetical protein
VCWQRLQAGYCSCCPIAVTCITEVTSHSHLLLHWFKPLVLPGVCVGSGCKLGVAGPKSYVGVDMSNAGLQPDGVTVKPDVASYPAVMAEYFPGEQSCGR